MADQSRPDPLNVRLETREKPSFKAGRQRKTRFGALSGSF